MAAVSNEDISVAFAHDQLLDDQQSRHVEADSPHFLSIAPGIFKSAKFGILRKLCQASLRAGIKPDSELHFFPLISCRLSFHMCIQQSFSCPLLFPPELCRLSCITKTSLHCEGRDKETLCKSTFLNACKDPEQY